MMILETKRSNGIFSVTLLVDWGSIYGDLPMMSPALAGVIIALISGLASRPAGPRISNGEALATTTTVSSTFGLGLRACTIQGIFTSFDGFASRLSI